MVVLVGVDLSTDLSDAMIQPGRFHHGPPLDGACGT